VHCRVTEVHRLRCESLLCFFRLEQQHRRLVEREWANSTRQSKATLDDPQAKRFAVVLGPPSATPGSRTESAGHTASSTPRRPTPPPALTHSCPTGRRLGQPPPSGGKTLVHNLCPRTVQ
jgi:hypothetical protein